MLGFSRTGRRPAPTHLPARAAAGRQGTATQRKVLDLQRLAGNRAVSALLGTSPSVWAPSAAGRAPTLQRHASWEHTMLGDTDPKQLGNAAVPGQAREHVLQQELLRALFFRDDAFKNPTESADFKDVKWIRLRGSGLWVSYGEMTSLADWMPPNFDTLPAADVLPGLQRMRQDTSEKVMGMLLPGAPGAAKMIAGEFQGAATISGAKGWAFDEAGVESDKAVDASTAALGADRYLSLVARNACHFAPLSWHRWAEFHQSASDFALAYYRTNAEVRPLKDVDTTADENVRQAWLQTGYGEHFLQDSFAAGHLINKTLVMQWFVDYVNSLASPWWDYIGGWIVNATRPWYGMPDSDVMENMGTAEQPDMAGRDRYSSPGNAPSLAEEWRAGFAPTDPQTTQERATREQRIGGSGVRASNGRSREYNYESYLQFLNSSFLSLAAGNTHDYFNHRGLYVSNGNGDVLKVGGDNSLLEKSDPKGAEMAAEASKRSQRAIDDLLTKGSTDLSVDAIWRLVPTSVFAAPWQDWRSGSMFGTRITGRWYGLEEWHDEVLHDICIHEIFPDAVDSVSSKAVRLLSPELSDSGVDKLQENLDPALPAPPLPEDIGDFVSPKGGSQAG